MTRNIRVFYLSIALFVIIAVALIIAYPPIFTREVFIAFVFFFMFTLGAEALPVRLPRGDGSVSVGFAIIYAFVLLYGVSVGMLLAAFGTFSKREFTREVAWHATVFNRAQLALSAAASGYIFMLFGGTIGVLDIHFWNLMAILAGGLAYMLVNATSATLYLALLEKIDFTRMWLYNIQWLLPNFAALIPLSYLIAVVYQITGVAGLVLFFFPLLLARHAFQRYMDMRKVYINTISSLTRALEAKDAYTYGHGDRVSFLAKKIGRKMNLSESDVEVLGYVGVLHDIGKIGVKDGILNKPGPFTGEEFREMKKHPEIGAEILKGVSFLGNGSKWVKYHHERLDGSGYPDGLIGDNIPLGARIIAVADAFDAIMSDRSYKKAKGLDFAVRELEANVGTQFDGGVVEALKAVLEDPESAKQVIERKVPIDSAVIVMAATGEKGEGDSHV